MSGMANDMAKKLDREASTSYGGFKDVGIYTAKKTAEAGGLVILAYKNPNGHGHVATLSVGNNLEKGEVANIGASNGFKAIESTSKTSGVFSKKTIGYVKYYVPHRPDNKPQTPEFRYFTHQR